MTKSEIEKLIEYIDDLVPKMNLHDRRTERDEIFCKLDYLYAILRDYPVECDKTASPNYEAMYSECLMELEKTKAHIESIKFDMHHMAIENAHYAGAVAAIETIFGRKFEPKK